MEIGIIIWVKVSSIDKLSACADLGSNAGDKISTPPLVITSEI